MLLTIAAPRETWMIKRSRLSTDQRQRNMAITLLGIDSISVARQRGLHSRWAFLSYSKAVHSLHSCFVLIRFAERDALVFPIVELHEKRGAT